MTFYISAMKRQVCKGSDVPCANSPTFHCGGGCGTTFCEYHVPATKCWMTHCKFVEHCGEAFAKCQSCELVYCSEHLNKPHTVEWKPDKQGYREHSHCIDQQAAGLLRTPVVGGVKSGCGTFTWPSGVVVRTLRNYHLTPLLTH